MKLLTKGRIRLSGPVRLGLLFALLATVLSVLGLWREHNLSLRNILLALALGGGTWGVIVWAIATAAVDVDKELASAERDATETTPDSTQRQEAPE